ncbi:MAG: hypothetical protein JNL01_03095 [Bdellovibrionales bacterium]|nr:hypothetical protein [Bdellovibrionales bacterium]
MNIYRVIVAAWVAVLGQVSEVHARSIENLSEPETVQLPVFEAFFPTQTHTDENAELILLWEFPSDCFFDSRVTVRVNDVDQSVWVQVSAKYFDTHFCGIAVLPQVEAVDLGRLKAGNYTAWDSASGTTGKKLGTLRVSKRMGNAPTWVQTDEIEFFDGKHARIRGMLPASCGGPREFRAQETATRFVEVFPYAPTNNCSGELQPWSRDFEIPIDPNRSTVVWARSSGRNRLAVYSPFLSGFGPSQGRHEESK